MAYINKLGHWQNGTEAAAEEARVSPSSLARTVRISRKLHPSVLMMFDRGQIDVRQAERLTRLPKGQQRKALQAIMLARPLSRVVDLARLR
jgi:hypothetical protein